MKLRLLGTFCSRRTKALVSLACLSVAACAAGAATNTVSNTNDNGAGTLRETIQSAVSGDTINISVTGVITLTNGELFITKNLTIIGPGAADLAISGNTNSRIFEIKQNVTASISGLTLRNGKASNGTNGGDGEDGGGIYNAGALT